MAVQMCLSVGMFAVSFPLLAIGGFDPNSLWAMVVKMACFVSFSLMLWAALTGFKRVDQLLQKTSEKF
jgi:NADH:ubiquinone oxidoreductase subunit H